MPALRHIWKVTTLLTSPPFLSYGINYTLCVLIAHEFVHTSIIMPIIYCNDLSLCGVQGQEHVVLIFVSIAFSLARSRNSINICWMNMWNPIYPTTTLKHLGPWLFKKKCLYKCAFNIYTIQHFFKNAIECHLCLPFSVTSTHYQPDTVLGTVDINNWTKFMKALGTFLWGKYSGGL